MSTGFRVFLLILFLFGAIWVYRFRSPEIEEWLRQAPHPQPVETDEPFASRVSRIPDLVERFTRVRLEGKEGPRDVEPVSERLSPEERLVPADLPVFESGEQLALNEASAPEEDPAGAEKEEERPPREVAEAEARIGGAPDAGAHDEILYTVQEGDSLWKIADKLLGSGLRYPEIRELNKNLLGEGNIDHLAAGAQLKVRISAPGKTSPPKHGTPQASSGRNRYIR